MSRFDECCVLIPAATLEDFPSDLSDYDARSLLAGWTGLWHPRLLRDCGKLPAWYRADSPPDPSGSRLVVVPSPSRAQLPSDYENRVRDLESSLWVTAANRDELIAAIAAASGGPWEPLPALVGKREISCDDFFAVGFVHLQVQVMTRRLRYTSNLDEVHLQNQAVAAANAFVEGDADRAIAALHDVFDLLAQERDHYFSSSDAHLIDLTLCDPTTATTLLDSLAANEIGTTKETEDTLATPINVLIDCDVAAALQESDAARLQPLRELIGAGRIGWAGGGPRSDVFLDAMSLSEAHSALAQANRECADVVGTEPRVFGRFTGGAPADLVGSLVELGYVGLIPLDFARGTGFGNEAKVTIASARGDLDAVTCKPIDAASDAAFLTIGTRLGEQIDGGEIATALLAHWPGRTCQAYLDLRRAAAWGLSLGRFWKLDDYFVEGERPYHQGSLPAASPGSSRWLESLVDRAQQTANPLAEAAAAARQTASEHQQLALRQLARLINPDPPSADTPVDAIRTLGSALFGPAAVVETAEANALLVANPYSTPVRRTVLVDGAVDPQPEHIFATAATGAQTAVTVDIPANGFVLIRPSSVATSTPTRRPLWSRLRPPFLQSTKLGAESDRSGTVRLFNEFMEVSIDQDTAAISGVYSGEVRGNRFSLRLVQCAGESVEDEASDRAAGTMQCTSFKTETSPSSARCTASGKLVSGGGEKALAEFQISYELSRGNRVLTVRGEVTPITRSPSDLPWQHYLAARAAFAEPTAIFRPIIRNKTHRTKSRRLVSPRGVLVDEAERQTLATADGRAFFRRVGDRFLDTLLVAGGASESSFTLHYVFDTPAVVSTAESLLAPEVRLPVRVGSDAAAIGWLIHASPKTVQVEILDVVPRRQGTAVVLRVIQSVPRSCKATLRFLHDVQVAMLIDGATDREDAMTRLDALAHSDENATTGESNEQEPTDEETAQPPAHDRQAQLKSEGDKVSLSLAAHGVADVLVLLG